MFEAPLHPSFASALRRALGPSLVLAYGGVLEVQLLLRASTGHEHGVLAGSLHWLRDGTLAIVPVLCAVALARWAMARRSPSAARTTRAAVTAGAAASALALGSAAHPLVDGAALPGARVLAVHAAEILLIALPAAVLLSSAVEALRRSGASAREDGAATRHSRLPIAPGSGLARRVVAGLGVCALTASMIAGVAAAPPAGAAVDTGGVCPDGARLIHYDLAAFQTLIPVNGWGDHMPDGLMYALRGDAAVNGKAAVQDNPNLAQPLVVRANVGDCIEVRLRNDIADRTVGIHPDGLVKFDPKATDGNVGRNDPSRVAAPGEDETYYWYADREGQAPINDIANVDTAAGVNHPDVASEEAGEHPGEDPGEETPGVHSSVERGLYGAVIVHPQGSQWRNPVTGAPLLVGGRAIETNVFADIHVPTGSDYRSFAMLFLDENEDILDARGQAPTFPTTGLADSTFGINYRSEPLRNRLRAILEHRDGQAVTLPSGTVIEPDDHFCDGWVQDAEHPDGFLAEDPGAKCLGEESHLQSWPFGDHGKLTHLEDGEVVVDSDLLIPKAYVGDPITFHIVNPGAKETHPWHQHTQRWFKDPTNRDPVTGLNNSPRLDVQSVGPGEAYALEIEGGAGGLQGTIGDSIFHCHLYPHFAQGFWGDLRIFDRLRDGTQEYPDGTPIEALQPLPDRPGTTPAADTEHPGFPLFVKGQAGQRAYRAPYAVTEDDFGVAAEGPEFRRPGDTVREPTSLEAANLPALSPDKPGNGYIDPCPANAPVRTYRPHAVDVQITYNSAGWTDPEGRMYIEEPEDGDIGAAARDLEESGDTEPYTIRARLGECVQLYTTNSLHLDDDPDEPIDRANDRDGVYMEEAETAEVSTHVHLVKFDELGSDGTSVGWNYVQAAMPGQTYGYRWFIDQPLRTVFFHDHQYANSHQQKGLYAALQVEPADATWHDPATGETTNGVGTVADIRSPSGPDFRELSVFYQDRSPMWRDGGAGDPVAPPGSPDDFGADQGAYAVNYRNEPFQIRVQAGADGRKADPAFVYSSAVHGDPSTPVFRAYEQDPVVIRFMTGAHEEVHNFNLHGHRWLSEPDNPRSTVVDTQTGALAEYFNFEIIGGRPRKRALEEEQTLERAEVDTGNGQPLLATGGAGPPGDYLYGSTALDDQWLGLWGIFRVPDGKVSDLQPLPDRAAPRQQATPWPALSPGDALNDEPPSADNTCPAGAPVRDYDVVALQRPILYNATTGDHDPNGAIFALDTQQPVVAPTGSEPQPHEPLFLRANVHDCLRITVRNGLPSDGIPDHSGDPPLAVDVPDFPKSNRVSLHSGMLEYDVTRADGATVGYNLDQTIAPGSTHTMYWYVQEDAEGATIPLVDFGDRRGHRHHGLFAGLLIEPAGSTWVDPRTGDPIVTGAQAIIRDATGRALHREFVVDWEDGLNLRDGGGASIPVAGDVDDPYEEGNRGVNYRTERFAPRLAQPDTNPALVMSSHVHGDPATPVFEAYAGDPVRLRVLQSSDRGRAHTFLLSGHEWRVHRDDPTSNVVSARGGLLPGEGSTHDLQGGAGGPRRISGDYLYRDGLVPNQTNAGLWGLVRVHAQAQDGLLPLSDFAPVANPPWAAPGAVPLMGDWNNDGIDTPGWYRNGRVWLRNSHRPGPPNITFTYGRAGDRPVVGDWNGDGTDTLGIVRGREWHLRNTNSAGPADRSFIYGRLTAGDYPLAGDWNNDTFDTVGIVRGGVWHLRNSNNAGPGQIVFRYGRVLQGDVPVTGDWTGDGTDTPGIVRGNEWHLRTTNTAGPANTVFRYGRAGDKPVPGAWSNNAADTPGIVRGLDWHLRTTNTAGAATISFDF